MALKTEDLYEKAVTLSKNVGDTFLDLGRTLRQLQSRDPKLFQGIIAETELGRRKAYYTVEISRVFEPLTVSRARLKKIGWTKLGIIAKHVTPENVDELLDLAENNTTKDIERAMRGERPMGDAHVVLMYFSPKQYQDLEKALLQHGASKSGRGMINKEKALMALIGRVQIGS
jgi:hypothetical protein